MPEIVVNSLFVLTHLILTILVCYYSPHFTNGETEAWKGECAQVTQLIDGRAGTRTQEVQLPGLVLLTT